MLTPQYMTVYTTNEADTARHCINVKPSHGNLLFGFGTTFLKYMGDEDFRGVTDDTSGLNDSQERRWRERLSAGGEGVEKVKIWDHVYYRWNRSIYRSTVDR